MSLLLFLIVQIHIVTEDQILTDYARWNIIQRKVQERNAVKAFTAFRSAGIEPLLIKGLAAAQHYPSDISRSFIDLDLAVAACDFDQAESIANSVATDGLAIDLHRELRHLDTRPWADLLDDSRLIEVDGGSYRVLRDEDHLRVLCVHWLNDGGINKDRLWDIFYLIDNRLDDFDWDRALNTVDPKRRRWIICTIALAHKYLNLDLTGTPIEHEVNDIPHWLIKTVEEEWARDQDMMPLWLVMKEPRKLVRQISARLNPNPIQATVEIGGSFDARTRFFYKIGNVFQRLAPSLRRNFGAIKR